MQNAGILRYVPAQLTFQILMALIKGCPY